MLVAFGNPGVAARQASKLLRGAKPSDLPVELATTVQLAINLKLAGQLDIVIPPALLQRAGEDRLNLPDVRFGPTADIAPQWPTREFETRILRRSG